MKIFVLISSPTLTGEAAALVDFLRQINSDKQHIRVFSDTYRDGDLNQHLQKYGFESDRSLSLSTVARLDQYITDIFKLARILRKKRPDALICCLSNDIFTALAARLLSQANTPVISYSSNAEKRKCSMSRVYMSRNIITTSQPFAKQEIENQISAQQDQQTVFRYPASMRQNKFFPASNSEKNTARDKYGFSENDLVIGSVGRFKDGRGQRRMLEAFGFFRREFPNAKLMLVGYGENYPIVKWSAKQMGLEKDVIFPGFLKDELVSAYHAMDAFVLPAIGRDGFGRATLEASACKLPVWTVEGECSTNKLQSIFNEIALTENLREMGQQNFELLKTYQKMDIEKAFVEWFERIQIH